MFERGRQGAVDVIRGDDSLSGDNLPPLATLFDECLRSGQPKAVLDLSKVALIDSAALELLLDYQESFQKRGGALKLAGANPLCREILTTTEVDRHFEIFGETVSAVGSFAQ